MSHTELKYLTVYPTMSAGVMSHLVLLICLAKDPLKCFRNSASYLTINLALADFTVCTGGLILTSFAHKFAVMNHILPALTWVSLFSILSIAVDRYLLTVRPFTHRVLLNGKRLAIWIASTWLLSLCTLVKTYIFGPDELVSIIYHTIMVLFTLLTGLIYLITYFSLRKQRRDIAGQRQSRNRSQHEFLKTITMVAFIQILTMVPENVRGLLESLSYQSDLTAQVILFQMYCLNFAINPFLYFWRLKNYRRTLCLIFCRKTQ
jgi:hypothetical protein